MPALTRLALAEPLVRLVGRGGLTPKGVGHSEIRIQPDGKLQGYHLMTDSWSSTQLSPEDLAELQETLKTTD
jgi:hypothetical protein